MLRQFLNPPNWFTTANIFCGFYAIRIIVAGGDDPRAIYHAGMFILFAGVFDMLDGRVARMTRSSSAFGTQLDSLADVVSFGFAPAMLAWAAALRPLGNIGFVVAFLFLVCGAFRLARFNLHATGKADSRSMGLTITAAGGTLAMLMAAYSTKGGEPTHLHAWNMALVTLLLSALMTCRVRYRTFKDLRLSPITLASFAFLGGLSVVVGMRYNIATTFALLGTVYTLAGPLEGMVRFGLRRRAAGVAPIPDDDTEPDED